MDRGTDTKLEVSTQERCANVCATPVYINLFVPLSLILSHLDICRKADSFHLYTALCKKTCEQPGMRKEYLLSQLQMLQLRKPMEMVGLCHDSPRVILYGWESTCLHAVQSRICLHLLCLEDVTCGTTMDHQARDFFISHTQACASSKCDSTAYRTWQNQQERIFLLSLSFRTA